MAVNIVGIVSLVVFYVLILAVGIWAAKKSKHGSNNTEDLMLAGRNIGLFVGVFTMTATFVGGAYINGIAEVVYNKDGGLLWCQGPIGYAITLVICAFFFADQMRSQGYVTMIDPFQRKYGDRMGGLLYIPALLGEIFWSAAILTALGSSLSVIIGLNFTIAIVISAFIAIAYTVFGGLYSVAYTDIVQLVCIFIGLWIVIPFALTHDAMTGRSIFYSYSSYINNSTTVVHDNGSLATGNLSAIFSNGNESYSAVTETISWLGRIDAGSIGLWVDQALLIILGGIPWQVYFQRVLSTKSGVSVRTLSYAAGVGCLILALPPLLIGAIARTADWSMTSIPRHQIPIPPGDEKLILPLVMQYLCPPAITFFGLGAVSAAVMSSADSCVLSSSSMFARNIYKLIFRQQASEREQIWVMRIGIFVFGIIATVIGIFVESTFALWFLAGDLVYVVLFPQLLSVIYIAQSNTYGSLAGYIVGFLLRLLGGIPTLRIPAVIHYPGYVPAESSVDDQTGEIVRSSDGQQMFPFKTLTMLLSLTTIVAVSYGSKYLFLSGKIDKKRDVFHCFVTPPQIQIDLKDSTLAANEIANMESKVPLTTGNHEGFD